MRSASMLHTVFSALTVAAFVGCAGQAPPLEGAGTIDSPQRVTAADVDRLPPGESLVLDVSGELVYEIDFSSPIDWHRISLLVDGAGHEVTMGDWLAAYRGATGVDVTEHPTHRFLISARPILEMGERGAEWKKCVTVSGQICVNGSCVGGSITVCVEIKLT